MRWYRIDIIRYQVTLQMIVKSKNPWIFEVKMLFKVPPIFTVQYLEILLLHIVKYHKYIKWYQNSNRLISCNITLYKNVLKHVCYKINKSIKMSVWYLIVILWTSAVRMFLMCFSWFYSERFRIIRQSWKHIYCDVPQNSIFLDVYLLLTPSSPLLYKRLFAKWKDTPPRNQRPSTMIFSLETLLHKLHCM